MPGRYDDEDDDNFASRLSKRASAGEGWASEGRSELGELIEMLGRRIGGAILVAGLAIGFGVYAGGDGDVEAQKYQAFSAGGEVFRLNTESGTVIACNAERCTRILDSDRDLGRSEDQGNTLFKAPAGAQVPAAAAAPQQALPAPATAQPQPQPQPQPAQQK